jgi:hypothetical protein
VHGGLRDVPAASRQNVERRIDGSERHHDQDQQSAGCDLPAIRRDSPNVDFRAPRCELVLD